MLNIITDALLIVARMDPVRAAEYPARPDVQTEIKAKRRWFGLRA